MAYKGQLLGRDRHGHGTYSYPNTFFKYEGEWEHNKKHGKGTLLLGDGGKVTGTFKNGEIMGPGVRTWPNGNEYVGDFHEVGVTGGVLSRLTLGCRASCTAEGS